MVDRQRERGEIPRGAGSQGQEQAKSSHGSGGHGGHDGDDEGQYGDDGAPEFDHGVDSGVLFGLCYKYVQAATE